MRAYILGEKKNKENYIYSDENMYLSNSITTLNSETIGPHDIDDSGGMS